MRFEAAASTTGDVSSGEARASADGDGDERISLADLRQVQEWALKLGVSVEQLRELVAQVGPRLSDLQQRLSKPPVVD